MIKSILILIYVTVPSTICLIFSLYTLCPLESTKVLRKFLNLFLISVFGPNIATHSLTEWPFMSSKFSILSIIWNIIEQE